MQKQTKSILEELSAIPVQDRRVAVTSRLQNLLEACMNAFDHMSKTQSQEITLEMERRFLNALRTRDIEKFNRFIRKLDEKDY